MEWRSAHILYMGSWVHENGDMVTAYEHVLKTDRIQGAALRSKTLFRSKLSEKRWNRIRIAKTYGSQHTGYDEKIPGIDPGRYTETACQGESGEYAGVWDVRKIGTGGWKVKSMESIKILSHSERVCKEEVEGSGNTTNFCYISKYATSSVVS